MISWVIIQLMILLWAIRMFWRYFFVTRNKGGLPVPPGPYGVPFLGYLPFLGSYPEVTFDKLAQQYGDIFQVQMGMQKAVVLNSLEAIKEALNKDVFSGRPDLVSINIWNDYSASNLVLRNGDAQWQFLRKLAIKALGMFASSRNSRLEAIVDEASEELYGEIKANAGKPFDPQRNIFECVAGVIGAAMFGGDFSSKDNVIGNSIVLGEKFGEIFATGTIMDTMPFGKWIRRNKVNELIKTITQLDKGVEKHIREHAISCEDEDEVRDGADAIALAVKQTPAEIKRQLCLTDVELSYMSRELFGAGFTTTMESFRWAINLLAVHPDIQERARRELVEVCGDHRFCLTDHYANIPYNEAMLLEIFRFSALVPLSVPHSAMEDTTLRGYFIPKGTTLIANLYAHHRSAKVFPDPNSFKPERFLTKDGKVDMDAAQLVVPFGVGKRRCIGENLARQELSLLIGRLLQKFEIHQDPSNPIDIHYAKPGLNRMPQQRPLIFKKIVG